MSSSAEADRSPRDEVLAAVRERAAEGNRYVKTMHVRDRGVTLAPGSIGRALEQLEDEGLLERYRETSTGVVWRISDELREVGEP